MRNVWLLWPCPTHQKSRRSCLCPSRPPSKFNMPPTWPQWQIQKSSNDWKTDVKILDDPLRTKSSSTTSASEGATSDSTEQTTSREWTWCPIPSQLEWSPLWTGYQANRTTIHLKWGTIMTRSSRSMTTWEASLPCLKGPADGNTSLRDARNSRSQLRRHKVCWPPLNLFFSSCIKK